MIIAVVGGVILLVGLIMVITPGPSCIFIPFGLSILATEFVWAKKLHQKFKTQMNKLKKRNKTLSLASEE